MRILIQKDGSQLNLDEDEVRLRLNEKRLTLSDRAYCEGARDWWIPLREVLESIASSRGERINLPSHWQQAKPHRDTRQETATVNQTHPHSGSVKKENLVISWGRIPSL